jgi:hypothetical protein
LCPISSCSPVISSRAFLEVVADGEGWSGHTSPLRGEAHLTWQAEPGHRRHNGSTSPFRWVGVSRSALCLLLQLTAGASQPIHQPACPVQALFALRPAWQCDRPIPERPRCCLALFFRCPSSRAPSVMFPRFGPIGGLAMCPRWSMTSFGR